MKRFIIKERNGKLNIGSANESLTFGITTGINFNLMDGRESYTTYQNIVRELTEEENQAMNNVGFMEEEIIGEMILKIYKMANKV